MKRIYLSLKGFGDFVVIADALARSTQNDAVELIISRRLQSMASKLLPLNINVTVIENIEGVLPAYDLRNRGTKFLNGLKSVREVVKKKLDGDSVFVLDIHSIRNELLFLSIPHKYLPPSNNIYISHALEFGIEINRNCSNFKPQKNGFVSIFPFASSQDRSMSKNELISLCNFLDGKGIFSQIICHKLDGLRVPEQLRGCCTFFETSSELIELMKGTNILITVDTVAMHLANYFDIPIFVISDAWQFFIPPRVLGSGRLYRKGEFERLYIDVASTLAKIA